MCYTLTNHSIQIIMDNNQSQNPSLTQRTHRDTHTKAGSHRKSMFKHTHAHWVGRTHNLYKWRACRCYFIPLKTSNVLRAIRTVSRGKHTLSCLFIRRKESQIFWHKNVRIKVQSWWVLIWEFISTLLATQKFVYSINTHTNPSFVERKLFLGYIGKYCSYFSHKFLTDLLNSFHCSWYFVGRMGTQGNWFGWKWDARFDGLPSKVWCNQAIERCTHQRLPAYDHPNGCADRNFDRIGRRSEYWFWSFNKENC